MTGPLAALLALLAGPARGADDTGLTAPGAPAVAVPATPSPPYRSPVYGWPPDSLPTTPMPGNPAVRVRTPGARVNRASDLGLSLRTSCAWPDWVEKGYLPIHIELDEQLGRSRALTLSLKRGYSDNGHEITREISLEPRGHLALDVAVPGFGPGQPSYNVTVTDHERGGEAAVYDVGASSWAGPTRDELMLVGRTLPELGAIDRYTAATPYMLWSAATFDDLPRGPDAVAAWTSLDVVVLDVTAGFPPAETLDPLLTWVRLGGALVIAGPEQAPPPAVAAWMQTRFWDPDLIGLDEPVYDMGMGRLVWYQVDRPDWDSTQAQALVIALQADGGKRNYIPDPDREGEGWLHIRTEDLSFALRGAIAGILLLVALIMGPVNLGAVHLSRRPSLLLVSTPILAVICSLTLLTWGLLRNGLDLKGTSRSLTLLDQRSGEAITLEGRAIYAGRAVASGLHPGPGTLVLPGEPRDDDGTYLIEGAEDRRISGTLFLPVRETTQLRVLSARATPRRLDVQGQTVGNHLGATIRQLVLRDAQGACWSLGQLPDGALGQLDRLPETEVRATTTAIMLGSPAGMGTTAIYVEPPLRTGTWMASVEGQPFRDDLGLTMLDQPGIAVVTGILEVP